MLVFNPRLKSAEMCMKEHKLTDLEVAQLIKDYTTDNARGAVEFYLDTDSTWKYKELTGHIRTSFESVRP